MSPAADAPPSHPDSPRVTARIAGAFYVVNIATILVSILLVSRIVIPGDLSTTMANLTIHGARFRTGIALQLVSTVASLGVAAFFYQLFKPVQSAVSLLAAFLRSVACAVSAVGYLFQLAPLHFAARTPDASTALSQLQNVALPMFSLHNEAVTIAIVFFGCSFLALSYLILRSSLLPRPLGYLTALSGLGGVFFLAPALATRIFPVLAGVGLVCESSLALWLLIRGVE